MPSNVFHGDVGASEVLRSLDHVLANRKFRASPRLSSFLRFVVVTTVDGRGARLKGYTIGVEALGRGDSFNPQIDPIVRVEAARLRRALARYYAADGVLDPIVIELPLGGYVPLFRWRDRRAFDKARKRPDLAHGAAFPGHSHRLADAGGLKSRACRPGAWLLPPPRSSIGASRWPTSPKNPTG
jgi:hypothetical protein